MSASEINWLRGQNQGLASEVARLEEEIAALKCQFAVKEKEIIRQWILARVTVDVIPADEGNEEGFIKNLLSLLNER